MYTNAHNSKLKHRVFNTPIFTDYTQVLNYIKEYPEKAVVWKFTNEYKPIDMLSVFPFIEVLIMDKLKITKEDIAHSTILTQRYEELIQLNKQVEWFASCEGNKNCILYGCTCIVDGFYIY